MKLVLFALRRPVTIFVAVITLALAAYLAVRRMPVDIFPNLGAPQIYVAQPYSGMDPSQMEGFLTYYYEYHFLYITGIEHVESKSIQGVALVKLVFHAGTNMNQAIAETVGYVNRARAFMPPGAVPPFIVRYDAGSVPVGQLVFSSSIGRPPAEMQNIALNQVRPLFATLPGVSAPPPFGGNQRTVVVRLDPDKLRQYRISPEDAIAAVSKSTTVLPSGSLRTGDVNRIVNSNASVSQDISEMMDAPVRGGPGSSVYLRDLGVAEIGTDIVSGYAHVNGKRTVYIEVTKRADASTLDVISRVRAAIPAMQAVCPEDVKIELVFDESRYVTSAIRSLMNEGMLGALLTALTVLLFLRDWRGALIVVLTIPFSLLGAVVWLWASGQSINIMTLGGLALAVGVLVDEATVEVENIHARMGDGIDRAVAVVEAARRTANARLLSMLAILAVFVPSFFLSGVARQLFVPLALAVGFAMITSYVLSSTLVPVLAAKLMRPKKDEPGILAAFYAGYLGLMLRIRWVIAVVFVVAPVALLWFLVPTLGTEIFPKTTSGQFQVRLRAAPGTRVERTELVALRALEIIKKTAGEGNVEISTAFIGVQPASYPINTIYLWTSGPQEAVLLVAVKSAGEGFEEKLRGAFGRDLPDVQISFEAGDIVSRVMSFGSDTPIEVAVQGPSIANNRAHAEKLKAEFAKLKFLRDLQFAQALDYPTVDVKIDRERAGQYGLTAAGIARSLVAATSSSRFIEPNYWRDPASGNGFQIQVEIPQHRMASMQDLADLPVMRSGESRPLLSDVASMTEGKAFGVVERYNMQRVVSLTANIQGVTLGEAAKEVRAAIGRAGAATRGSTVSVRGQVPALEETQSGLQIGFLIAAGAIFLLLTASFQSARVALAIFMTLPVVLCGVILALKLTGGTLNIQSFLGAIMALGIATANSILLVTFAEAHRREGTGALESARLAASGRLRAIVMTASAMIAGMLPLAFALGTGAEQNGPLGRAVIGGLVAATFATLTILPAFYAILQGNASREASLLPASSIGENVR